MRIVKIWRLLELVRVTPWRASRGQVVRLASPEWSALETDFFARGSDLEDGAIAGSDEWDTRPLSAQARR